MNRSVLLILAVAVLATTAGCAGVLDDGTPSSGADGESSADATSEDGANETVDFPDGTGESGLDADELSSRQATILKEGSYTIEMRETTGYRGGTFEESIVLAVDGERKIQKTGSKHEPATADSVLGRSTSETWLFTESANETLVRRSADSDERYRLETGPTASGTIERQLRDELDALLRVPEYELTDVENADGSTVVTYEVTGMNEEVNQLYPLADEYDEFTATVSVSDEGIERYAYEFEATDGSNETFAVETTFSDVDQTELEKPAWAEEGYERVPATSISTDNERTIAITLESGDPFPENGTVSLRATDGYHNVTSLDEAVEPGETLYLTARDGRLRESVDAEPEAGDAIDTEWFRVTVRTESGLIAYEEIYEETTG